MNWVNIIATVVITSFLHVNMQAQTIQSARDWGIQIGVLKPGKLNSITDVTGVTVGHSTVKKGDTVNTGVTVIIPHSGNIFQQKFLLLYTLETDLEN